MSVTLKLEDEIDPEPRRPPRGAGRPPTSYRSDSQRDGVDERASTGTRAYLI